MTKEEEAAYEQGFIDGVKQNTLSKVTKFIDQNLREPLTEGQIKALLPGAVRLPPGWLNFARAIEQAHGIK